MVHDLKSRFYPEARFGGFTRVDGTIAFYQRVSAFVEPRATVLDIGCGRGDYRDDPVPIRRSLRILRGKCRKVIGIDVDPRAAENQFIDEFVQITGTPWSIQDSSVDVCLCDYVLEHIEDVSGFFSEVMRVLKPGGVLCLRTPNLWGYAAFLSNLIPDRWHERIVGRVQTERQRGEAYPTFYRCNTPRALGKMLTSRGFESVVYCHEPEPGYLDFSAVAYFFGILYGALIPPFMKNVLFAFATKKS